VVLGEVLDQVVEEAPQAAVELGHRGPVGHQGVQVGVAGEAVGRHEAPQAVAEGHYAGHPQLLSQEPAGRGEYLCEGPPRWPPGTRIGGPPG